MTEMVAIRGKLNEEWIISLVFNTFGISILLAMLNLMKNYHNFRFNIHKKELFTYGFFILIFAIFNTCSLFILRKLSTDGFFKCFWKLYKLS
jgi:hypothetical protein